MKAFAKFRQFILPAIVCAIVAVVCFSVLWAVLARSYAVDIIKKEFRQIIAEMNAVGYDIAYDRIKFSSTSPFKIMEIENFMFYKMSGENRFEYKIPNLVLNADIFNYKHLSLTLSEKQTVRFDGKQHLFSFEAPKIMLTFDDSGFDSFYCELKDAYVNDVFKIEKVNAAVKKSFKENATQASFDTYLELANIELPEENHWSMAQRIEEFYVNAEAVQGENAKGYFFSLRKWLNEGGKIEVKKMILNWKPLVLVSRGNVSFDNAENPTLKLITTSKALFETMDNLENAGVFDKKGVFVSKIILSNKAQKNSDNEPFYTVITPMTLSGKEMTIEGIPMLTFSGN